MASSPFMPATKYDKHKVMSNRRKPTTILGDLGDVGRSFGLSSAPEFRLEHIAASAHAQEGQNGDGQHNQPHTA